jgi:hypothetical protein
MLIIYQKLNKINKSIFHSISYNLNRVQRYITSVGYIRKKECFLVYKYHHKQTILFQTLLHISFDLRSVKEERRANAILHLAVTSFFFFIVKKKTKDNMI